jgi:hypothetical protein
VSACCLLLPLAAVLSCRYQKTLVVGSDPAVDGGAVPGSLTEGLVAYWKLDDGPGAPAAHDSSGHANHAVPESVSVSDWIQQGHIGGALLFGNAGWLRGTEIDAVNTIATGGLSMAMWIFLPGSEDREQVVLQRQLGIGSDAHFLLSLRGGRLALSGATITRCEGPALAPGAWLSIAATFDGTTARLYVGGAEVAACPTAGAFAPDTTSVTVGGRQFGPSPFDVDRRLRATLDEIVLYNRALTPGEIAALAAGQLPPGQG